MAEKYIEIDGATGEPSYIPKNKGQKIPGVPKDDDLCHITFKKTTIPKATPGGEQIDVPAYDFDCDVSPECRKKNEDAEAMKRRVRAAIDAQDDIIKAANKTLEPIKEKLKKDKKLTETEKEQKEKAEDRLTKAKKIKKALEDYLKSFPRYCNLKAFVGPGGNDKLPSSGRIPVDEIKERKIENLVCVCDKIKVPKPPKDTGLE